MISDTLKAKNRQLVIDTESYQADLKCEKKVSFPKIKEALTIWVETVFQAGLIITDNILSTKALGFTFLLKEDKFKCSDEWVDNFKKWHNLRQYNIYDEVASALLKDLDTMQKNL